MCVLYSRAQTGKRSKSSQSIMVQFACANKVHAGELQEHIDKDELISLMLLPLLSNHKQEEGQDLIGVIY